MALPVEQRVEGVRTGDQDDAGTIDLPGDTHRDKTGTQAKQSCVDLLAGAVEDDTGQEACCVLSCYVLLSVPEAPRAVTQSHTAVAITHTYMLAITISDVGAF